MLIDYDYRFCIEASLQVMQRSRKKIIDDTLDTKGLIAMGLHETDKVLRKLRFQYYLIKWLDEHWNTMQSIIDAHPEYSMDQKKQIILFFAQNYSNMLDKWTSEGVLAKLIIPDILRVQKEKIEEMMQCAEKWEHNFDKLKVMTIKHKEQFEEEIRKYESKEE